MARKVGIYYAFWTHEWEADFLPFVAKVRALGFDQLEVNGAGIVKLGAEQRKRLVAAARDHGLTLSHGIGLPPERDVSAVDEGVRRAGVAYMRELIEAVGDMGGGTICGTVHSCWPATLPKGFADKSPFRAQSLKSMRELVKVAEDRPALQHQRAVCLAEAQRRFSLKLQAERTLAFYRSP
jgi:D-psicose/D-tagatose/L-ribulose 3-epimerase